MLGILLATKRPKPGRSSVAENKVSGNIDKDPWINRWWRPGAAVVYLIICLCDFIFFPWFFGLDSPSVQTIALAVKDLDPSVGSVLATPRDQWQPLTLMGGGMFHVSFGAILGVAAWTRGAEKVEQLRMGSVYQNGQDSRYDRGGYGRNDYGYDSGYGYDRGGRDHGRSNRRYSRNDDYGTGTEDEVDNPDI